MDPLYATEHREGGTRALGTGVPGLTRSDLSVFSEAEWQAQKRLLVHGRWRELASANRPLTDLAADVLLLPSRMLRALPV
jgi:hypothetical protein